MSKTFLFVTGTDTGVGKTRVASGLLHGGNKRGLTTVGIKPVASGCELIEQNWRNEDALTLQQSANYPLDYSLVNPIALPQAIAPHLAAGLNNVTLSTEFLVNHCQTLQTLPAELFVVEGAGGWLVPLNATETFADFAVALSYPVILVVGIRLGCINHALLTVAAIAQRRLKLAAWVANCIETDTIATGDIINSLRARIEAPCMGVVPFTQDRDVSNFLDLNVLNLDVAVT